MSSIVLNVCADRIGDKMKGNTVNKVIISARLQYFWLGRES